jgi:hypothetical protein
MPSHTTTLNARALANITVDTGLALLDQIQLLQQLLLLTTQPQLEASAFSDLASRLDDLDRLAGQFEQLNSNLSQALTKPTL